VRAYYYAENILENMCVWIQRDLLIKGRGI